MTYNTLIYDITRLAWNFWKL